MTKRFTDNYTECLIDSSFTDNLTKKIYSIDEWESIIGLCNNLWEQTQRFEKENQALRMSPRVDVNEIESLVRENEELKSTIRELYDMVKCDVDNGIEVYPKTLVKYIANILKIIGDVE